MSNTEQLESVGSTALPMLNKPEYLSISIKGNLLVLDDNVVLRLSLMNNQAVFKCCLKELQ